MKLNRIACVAVLSILCISAMSTMVQAQAPSGWVQQDVYVSTLYTDGHWGYTFENLWVPSDAYFVFDNHQNGGVTISNSQYQTIWQGAAWIFWGYQ